MMTTESPCLVHHLGGSFLVLDPDHALYLRRRRIVCQPIGGGNMCSPIGPYYLSLFAVYVLAKRNLVTFMCLEEKTDVSLATNAIKCNEKLANVLAKESERYMQHRQEELKKHNVPAKPETIKPFDHLKLRLTLHISPERDYSSMNEAQMESRKVVSILDQSIRDKSALLIFEDLFVRGFYIGSGMKFGANFLVYEGDPVLYHAQFAVKIAQATQDGFVDLSNVDYNILNGFQRLTHTANKIPLLATIVFESDNKSLQGAISTKIRYWTLGDREYLRPDSKMTDFKSIDPNPESTNKTRRTD